jgi:hypothetical protein
VTADLVAFLNARLDEDEQIAQATCCPDWTDEGWKVLDSNAALDEGLVAQTVQFQTDADHIARWDPARVLADVQAKRAILDDIVDEVDGLARRVDSEWGIGDYDPTGDAADRLVRLLALPYRDHADYRPEWAPDA